MGGDVVIGLHEILHQHLPVPVAGEIQRAGDGHVVEAIGRHIIGEARDLRGEGGRGLVQGGEDEALPDLGAELRQAAEFGRLKLACPRGKGARSAVKGAQIDWYLNGQQKLLTKPAGTLRPEFFTDDSRLKLKNNR